ncbi:hypothetical protein PIB30_053298 [Stylosanthes scabra]|uniref:Uncharacterized protein n=1 Tax=Stylosanthes scabra TaxID=79078 RepID=A0ABU6VHD4_9FABA|nr:hypothetical protein [Stylosanthes scabra]
MVDAKKLGECKMALIFDSEENMEEVLNSPFLLNHFIEMTFFTVLVESGFEPYVQAWLDVVIDGEEFCLFIKEVTGTEEGSGNTVQEGKVEHLEKLKSCGVDVDGDEDETSRMAEITRVMEGKEEETPIVPATQMAQENAISGNNGAGHRVIHGSKQNTGSPKTQSRMVTWHDDRASDEVIEQYKTAKEMGLEIHAQPNMRNKDGGKNGDNKDTERE